LEIYGIERTVFRKMKTSLETPIRYKGTDDMSNQIVKYTYPCPTASDYQHLHIIDAEKFLQIILLKIYKPGSSLWLQTLSRLKKWETLPEDLLVELVNLVFQWKKETKFATKRHGY
jgi:hypothetical protein